MLPTQSELIDSSILIVDDEPTNVLLLEHILSDAGYKNLDSESDPRQVQGLHQRKNYDAILLDLHMPHLNGFEVLAQLNWIEDDGYVPVIMLTADNSPQSRLDALREGARDFLTKPFDQAEVLSRLANLLEVRLLHKKIRTQNSQLEERVRERTEELNKTRIQAIRGLGKAAEYRDTDTGLHVVRISRYAELLARAMGLSESECENILHAAPMHDLGKIGIPDAILLKSGRLTPQEWEVMKTHTVLGEQLLSEYDSELFKSAALLARTHHECWDGSGYPDGLKGTEIPLISRLVSVCDVFDALVSERPYKQPWSTKEAMNYLEQGVGKHFDPQVVELFQTHLKEILVIRAELMDDQPTHDSTGRLPLSSDGDSRLQSTDCAS